MKTIKVTRIQQRTFDIEVGECKRQTRAEGGEERRVYPLSFSSETPVRKWSWDGEYFEILGHGDDEVDLSAAEQGLPMFKSHQRLLHCGSIWDVEKDKKRRLAGGAEFSSIPIGQEEETKLIEGHTRTVSVGYELLPGMTLVGTDEATGLPIYRFKWRPLEVSIEPIPADRSVGFGRSRPGIGDGGAEEQDAIEFVIGERAADPPREGERGMGRTHVPGGTPETPPVPAGGLPAERVAVVADLGKRNAEVQEILDVCKAHGVLDRASGWIAAGLTMHQVSSEILNLVRTKGPGSPAAESLEGMPARDRGRYSVQRAIRLQVERMEGKRETYDGLEAEVHAELGKRRAGTDHGGILIPWRLRTDEEVLADRRTLGTTQATGGATLVPQQVMPDMIDLLRNRAIVLVAGAKLYPGLQGVVLFNKKTGAPTVEWMQENPAADATASEPTYGYVGLSPKTLIGTVQIPRQLTVMSSIDVEADIRSDLATGTGLAIDLGGIHGTGADKQPVGIYSAADVQTKAYGGVPSITTLTDAMAQVADKNADLGAMGWVTTPLMAGVLKRTPIVSTQALMIWSGTFRNGEVGGYPAFASSQVSKTLESSTKHGIIFGNWNDLVVGMWGNDLEIVVDVVTKAARGQIVITSYSMADTAVLRGDSFVKGTGATLS